MDVCTFPTSLFKPSRHRSVNQMKITEVIKMELNDIPTKRINELEQMTAQLLKTMRSSQLHRSDLYASLQEFEQQLGEKRRSEFDENNSTYPGY